MLAPELFHANANSHEFTFPSSSRRLGKRNEFRSPNRYLLFLSCFRFFFRSSARSLALLRWPVPTLVFIILKPGAAAPILLISVSLFPPSQISLLPTSPTT